MMQVTGDGDLEVHAGLEWGSFVCVENDIFGDCVNTAARLCDLANQRELLVGALCFQHLDGEDRANS
jgi:class 3 adenylate cyclase